MARTAEREEASIAEYFEADHARLDAVLERTLEAALLDDRSSARSRFAVFEGGLRRHIRAEEEVLFPAFQRAARGASGPVALMLQEHRTIEGILDRIAAALRDSLPIEEWVDRLRAVLGGHNEKEEQVLYPACDADLPAPERARVLDASRILLVRR